MYNMYMTGTCSMIEVFKTDMNDKWHAQYVIAQLQRRFPDSAISFDGEDCDRILRVESDVCITAQILNMVQSYGYTCQILPD